MNTIQVTVLPNTLQENESESNTSAIVSERLFERLFGSEPAELLAINVYTDERRIAITCMPGNCEGDVIYLPDWACQHLAASDAFVDPIAFGSDAIPRARTLRVQILDDELDHGLVRDELEKYLYDFKFLQPHIILTVPLEEAQIEVQILIESIIDEDGFECDGPALLGAELELDIAVAVEAMPEEPVHMPEEPIATVEPMVQEEEPKLKVPTADEKEAIREARLRRFANM